MSELKNLNNDIVQRHWAPCCFATFCAGYPFPLCTYPISSAFTTIRVRTRVSFETCFDSKQPKLEPKLVSALSETKRLFLLFLFYTKTESFDVSIEPKQTEDQPKQFYWEHILLFCQHCFICRSSDSAVSEDTGLNSGLLPL